jgi:hypothetical protein
VIRVTSLDLQFHRNGENLGQALDAVTATRRVGFCFSFPKEDFALRCGHHHTLLVIVQWLVHFSAHPQVMQQHRQLSGRGNDGSFLPASSATLGQPQAPTPQIAVGTERSQNMLRPLHQQRAQIGVAFLADVQLRLTLP